MFPRRVLRHAVIAVIAAAATAVPLSAQVPQSEAALAAALRGVPGQPISLSRTIEASLAATDPRLPAGHRFHVWEYTGRAGERLVIDQSSSAFDAFLMLVHRGANGAGPRMVDANDDGPDNTDAQLAVELPESGSYLIIATSLEETGIGTYRLTLRAMDVACAANGPCAPRAGGAITQAGSAGPEAAISAAAARDIRVGVDVTGRFDERSATLPSGEPFDVWRFTGSGGDTLVIVQRSGAFDARLWLYALEDGSLRAVGDDDDSGGGSDAELVVALPRSGEYLLVAAGYSESSRGEYQASVHPVRAACEAGGPCAVGESTGRNRRLQPVASATHTPIELGARVSDTLISAMPSLEGRGHFRVYRFRANAGERVVIELRSGAFDAYVLLGRLEGQRVRHVGEDDDGGVGTNSRLVAVLPVSGEYVVVAAALEADETGPFTLSVERCDAECAGRSP